MELAYDDRQRLDRLEARTAGIEARLTWLERHAGVRIPEPPPVIREHRTAPRWEPPATETMPPSVSPQPEQVRERSQSDLELAIGSRGLLWVGGLVTVIGLAYLVGLAINRGLISPKTQFIGELVLCLAFIGVGVWKRPQRVEFGDLLVGLGACGMYLSFAAGHIDKHLFGSETLIGLFVGLSALNVVYGAWRGAQAFVWIGLLGGLIASGMPLREPGHLPLSVSLYLLSIVPVAIVGGRRRWPGTLMGAWILGLPFSGAIAFSAEGPWAWRVAGVTLGTLAALAALVGSRDRGDKTIRGAFGWIAVPGTAAIVAYHAPGLWMSACVGAFAAAALGVGLWATRKEPGEGILHAAGATALVFVPFGWSHLETSAIFAGLAVAAFGVGWRWRARECAVVAAGGFGLGVYAYLWAAAKFLPLRTEVLIVIGLMLALGGAIGAASRARANLNALVFGALVGAPLVMRLGVLILEQTGLPVLSASAFAGAVYAAILAICAAAWRSKGAWRAAWAVFLFAFGAFVLDLLGNSRMPQGFAVPMLLLFMVSSGLLAGSARGLGAEGGEAALQGIGGCFFGALWVRLAVVVLPLQADNAIAWGALSFGLFVAIVATLFNLRGPLLAGYGAFGLACYAYSETAAIPWGHRVGLVGFGIAVLVALTLAGCRDKYERPAILNAAALVGWWVFTHFVWVLLTGSELAVTGQGSMTIGMTVYALILIALGFGLRERILRYWSLAIFAVAALKVVIVDLSGLDSALRVLVLMGLGVAMIGGAYAYIRYERRILAGREG